jgi:thiosulfate/3-mercaptopyruvate sulfurtransferase
MNYAHPETLVDTAWVDEHKTDPGIVVVEVDVDPANYREGHIAGAVGWDWHVDLCDTNLRDVLPHDRFVELMSRSGITRQSRVVIYGDSNNWFAAWAFWQLKMFGHEQVQLMDGGRAKWLAEGRALTREMPSPTPSRYDAPKIDFTYRAFLPDVQKSIEHERVNLVDVRSPAEFTGEILAPPGLPETCQRGGHIPGAVSVPWGKACRDDGTFKSADELDALYRGVGVNPENPTIAYCRIGERSSHTWFVLKYLLGHANVKNYDGSWTEWGNLVRAPIER